MATSLRPKRAASGADSIAAPLSARLRALVTQIRGESADHAEQTLEVIQAQIPDYARMRDPALKREVLDMIVFTHQVCLLELLELRLPTAAALTPTTALVRRRVHQGVPLPSVLQAFRVGFRVVWDVMLARAQTDPQMREELLFKVSPIFMDLGDLLAQTLTATYAEEMQQRGRWRDRVRHELCGILYTDADNVEGFRERALSLGLDPSAPHLALALGMPELKAAADEQQLELDRTLSRAARILGAEPESLLRTLRPGYLLLWMPVPMGGGLPAERTVAAQARALIDAGCGVDAVGIGLPEAGAAGWRRSADQALAAIEIGSHFQQGGAVYRYSDVALEHTVMESPVLTRLLQSRLEQIDAKPMLLETLRAWFEHGPHRKAVAAALKIHPNSLAYRIECIEAILEERLDDLRQLSRLHLALRLRQLSLPRPGRNGGTGRKPY